MVILPAAESSLPEGEPAVTSTWVNREGKLFGLDIYFNSGFDAPSIVTLSEDCRAFAGFA
ncbi:hypothetical protein DSM3645_16465 [Blastopirellula marina DSM 3645]|uniref:Uncharacterized protein n=1 Tax=Blastopirellula marina DSM 3645 TaxID=314230 RepID=A3ZN71_9BACT|nr:hypothetical protein DSM3645_16465 [Blastopirellula marina DSM 3645]